MLILTKMKAARILHQKAVYLATQNNEVFRVSIVEEIFKIPEAQSSMFPDGFKLSFIAFRNDEPTRKVLLDCHPPKGPHYHIGEAEFSFEWSGLEDAEKLFWQLVENEFGVIEEVLE